LLVIYLTDKRAPSIQAEFKEAFQPPGEAAIPEQKRNTPGFTESTLKSLKHNTYYLLTFILFLLLFIYVKAQPEIEGSRFIEIP
jgi:hypothetical protein